MANLDWLGTDAGKSVLNAAGAGLGAWGQAQANKANQQSNAAQLRMSDYYNRQNMLANRASGVLNADPLGADQQYAQRNALLSSILGNYKRSTPGNGAVAGAMGAGSGLTQMMGSLDPSMVNSMFGPQSTMAAITQRHKDLTNLDPRAAQADLGSLYGNEAAAPYVKQMQDWAAAAQHADDQTRAQYESQINALIQQQAANDKPGGFWHNLAKVAAVGGGLAATLMTGGAASPLLIAGIGAGSGALGAWGNGSNPLMGAIIGGAGAYGGAKLGAPGTLTKAVPTTIQPRLPAASLGADVLPTARNKPTYPRL